ncbi:helix-turn-helix domain-containing protein [Muricoccus radiodurans]|uniref:helix-turn-helix domain-containing protein n=1 Tax=Muricoccus radiodurans TaxID=2231721 RepID=UPI003CE79670
MSDEAVSVTEEVKSSTPMDAHVGGRIRLRRMLLGMSQTEVAEALSISFQQVQKYERGVNRIGASRLFELARVLDVPISFFFDDASDSPGASVKRQSAVPSMTNSAGANPLHQRETLELVRAYYRIADPAIRKRVLELTKSLGEDFAGQHA